MTDVVLAALSRIDRRLARIERHLRARRCTPADLELLQRLLPAWAGRLGSQPVLVAELRTRRDLAGVLGSLSARSLGCLLSRAAADRVTVQGYRVQRVTREHGAAVWRVVKANGGS